MKWPMTTSNASGICDSFGDQSYYTLMRELTLERAQLSLSRMKLR